MFGHALQSNPSFVVPIKFLFDPVSGGDGTLALMRYSHKFVGLLLTVKGGSGKQSARYWF